MKKALKVMLALAALLTAVFLPGLAPNADKGDMVTVQVHVTHCCNNKDHHVNWVSFAINGHEMQRWVYEDDNLPPNPDFTVEYTFNIAKTSRLTAEANCNLHGSAGPATARIAVRM